MVRTRGVGQLELEEPPRDPKARFARAFGKYGVRLVSFRSRPAARLRLARSRLAERNEPDSVLSDAVQSNHLHFVAESSDECALTRGMIGLVVRLARGLNRLWKRSGQVFPDRYHARALTTPRAVRLALVYVLQNGKKHDAWRAPRPDVYSSGPTFGGWREPEKVAQSSLRLLPRARTWLLTVGWRRHGLIDLVERPSIAA